MRLNDTLRGDIRELPPEQAPAADEYSRSFEFSPMLTETAALPVETAQPEELYREEAAEAAEKEMTALPSDSSAYPEQKALKKQQKRRKTLLMQVAAVFAAGVVVSSSFGLDFLGSDAVADENDSYYKGSSGNLPVSYDEKPDAAFPVLTDLEPNCYVPGFGVMDDDRIILSVSAKDSNVSQSYYQIWIHGPADAAPPGVSYDRESNTLTLQDYNEPGADLDLVRMGNGFKLKIEGDCHLGFILTYGYGTSLTICGSGKLTLNEWEEKYSGISLQAAGGASCIMIEPSVTVISYKGMQGIDTACEKGIYYLAPTTMYGAKRTNWIQRTEDIEADHSEIGLKIDNYGYQTLTVSEAMGYETLNSTHCRPIDPRAQDQFVNVEFRPGSTQSELSNVEKPDDAFPVLTDLEPNCYVPGFGVMNDDSIDVRDPGGNHDGGDISYSVWYHGGSFMTAPGMIYSRASNTLTLTNCNLPGCELSIVRMGNGLKIKVEGNCRLGTITCYGYGTSLTICGSGTLTLNEGDDFFTGINLQAAGGESCIMIEPTVTVISRKGMQVLDTTCEKGIYYLAPMTMNGAKRGTVTGSADAIQPDTNTRNISDYYYQTKRVCETKGVEEIRSTYCDSLTSRIKPHYADVEFLPGASASENSSKKKTYVEKADAAFPVLTDLEPNSPVPGYGVLNDDRIEVVTGIRRLEDGSLTASGTYTLWNNGVSGPGPQGVRYDRASNTLVLDNCDLAYAQVWLRRMGNGFRIQVNGNCRLYSINATLSSNVGELYGTSITFCGNGTLTVGNTELGGEVHVNCGGGRSCIMIEPSVTLSVADGIHVYQTSCEKGIYYLSPMVMVDSQRNDRTYAVENAFANTVFTSSGYEEKARTWLNTICEARGVTTLTDSDAFKPYFRGTGVSGSSGEIVETTVSSEDPGDTPAAPVIIDDNSGAEAPDAAFPVLTELFSDKMHGSISFRDGRSFDVWTGSRARGFGDIGFDEESWTLVLQGCNRPEAEFIISDMGNDFRIRIEGDCHLKTIHTLGTGSSITFCGSGTLTLQELQEDDTPGVLVNAMGGDNCIMIEPSVTLISYTGMQVNYSSCKKGIYYLSPMQMVGAKRAVQSCNVNEPHNDSSDPFFGDNTTYSRVRQNCQAIGKETVCQTHTVDPLTGEAGGKVVFKGNAGRFEPSSVQDLAARTAKTTDYGFPVLTDLEPNCPLPGTGVMNDDAIFAYIYRNNMPEQQFLWNNGVSSDTVAGMHYDRASNTLTLKDVNEGGGILYLSRMGNGFRIKVEGFCQLGQIITANYGTSITFCGNGILWLSRDNGASSSILLEACGGKSCIMIEPTVTLRCFAGINVDNTGCDRGIYYPNTVDLVGAETVTASDLVRDLGLDSLGPDGLPNLPKEYQRVYSTLGITRVNSSWLRFNADSQEAVFRYTGSAKVTRVPAGTEKASSSFPVLTNLLPNSMITGLGIPNDNCVYALDYSYLERYPLLSLCSRVGNTLSGDGILYDGETNTLYLDDFDQPQASIYLNHMGNGFRISVKGDCHVGCISTGFSGTSITFCGSGTLTVNEQEQHPFGINLLAGGPSCVMIEPTVTLHCHNGIRVSATTCDKGIYFLSPTTVSGGSLVSKTASVSELTGYSPLEQASMRALGVRSFNSFYHDFTSYPGCVSYWGTGGN